MQRVSAYVLCRAQVLLHSMLEVLFFFFVGRRGQPACQNMFIKVVNNLSEGWMITEEEDGFSAVGNDFLQYFTGVLHN